MQVGLVPTPTNGQWTVNFCITDTDNGNSNAAYNSYGILGNGTNWNALSGGQFSSTAPVKQDDGATTSPISLIATNYPGHYASAAPYNNILLDVYSQCDTNGTAFIFSGVPSGTYNLAVYGCVGSYTNRGVTFTVNGVSQSLTNAQDTYFAPYDNTALFTNVNVSGSTLELDMIAISRVPAQKTTNSDEGDFNGVQIQMVSLNPPSGPVTLTNVWDGTHLTLSWAAGDLLLQSTNVLGPWTTNGSSSPVVITPADPMEFYRVQVP